MLSRRTTTSRSEFVLSAPCKISQIFSFGFKTGSGVQTSQPSKESLSPGLAPAGGSTSSMMLSLSSLGTAASNIAPDLTPLIVTGLRLATTTTERSWSLERGILPFSPEQTVLSVVPVSMSQLVFAVPGLSPQSTVETYNESASGCSLARRILPTRRSTLLGRKASTFPDGFPFVLFWCFALTWPTLAESLTHFEDPGDPPKRSRHSPICFSSILRNRCFGSPNLWPGRRSRPVH